MRHLITLILFIGFTVYSQNVEAQLPGDPDLTFGTGGFNIRDAGAGNAFGRDVAIQQDGKIIVACIVSNGTDNDFALVRYTTDGKIDTTFGNGGIVTYDFASSTEITEAVAIDHANRIIVAGSVDTGDGFAFAAVRFTPEGAVDATFGVLGFVLVKSWTTGFCNSIMVQEDHKILLSGYAFNPVSGTNEFVVVRFLETGQKDSSFGQQGIVMTHVGVGAGVANAMTLQQDGKIILAGQALNSATLAWDICLARYETNGLLDETWGTEGIAFKSFPNKNFTINALAIDLNKNIVVAGYLGTAPSNNLYAVARFDKEGTPDASFGTDGLVTNTFGAENNQINDLEIQPDGFMIISGSSLSGNSDRFAIARLDQTGQPDPMFGQLGVVITPLGQNDGIKSTALQSDGKLIVTGESFNGNRFQLVVGRYETTSTTSIQDHKEELQNINVFPNPAQSYFELMFTPSVSDRLRVTLMDLQGNIVAKFPDLEVSAGQMEWIPLQIDGDIPSGVYFLSLSGKTTKHTLKLILQQ